MLPLALEKSQMVQVIPHEIPTAKFPIHLVLAGEYPIYLLMLFGKLRQL